MILFVFYTDISLTKKKENRYQLSHLTKISGPSINKYLTAIRLRIFDYSQGQSSLKGESEVDESYLDPYSINQW